MTTDELYIESFKVGDKYNELLRKVVDDVLDTLDEEIRNGRIDKSDVDEAVTNEVGEWLASWFAYPMYVTLHFGIYNVIDGCDEEDSPSAQFMQEVQNAVEDRLENDDVEIVD